MAYSNWQAKFEQFFSELDDVWNLELLSNIDQVPRWLQTQFKGMATFECSTTICNNRWTSVNAGAIFYYHLETGPNDERHGKVKLFLGGQKCKKCKNVFEAAQWHDSEIAKAITKVLNKVKQRFYDSNEDSSISTTENAYVPGDRSGPHETSLCQFCALGVCKYDEQNDIDSIASALEDLDWGDYDDDYSTSDSG